MFRAIIIPQAVTHTV